MAKTIEQQTVYVAVQASNEDEVDFDYGDDLSDPMRGVTFVNITEDGPAKINTQGEEDDVVFTYGRDHRDPIRGGAFVRGIYDDQDSKTFPAVRQAGAADDGDGQNSMMAQEEKLLDIDQLQRNGEYGPGGQPSKNQRGVIDDVVQQLPHQNTKECEQAGGAPRNGLPGACSLNSHRAATAGPPGRALRRLAQ